MKLTEEMRIQTKIYELHDKIDEFYEYKTIPIPDSYITNLLIEEIAKLSIEIEDLKDQLRTQTLIGIQLK